MAGGCGCGCAGRMRRCGAAGRRGTLVKAHRRPNRGDESQRVGLPLDSKLIDGNDVNALPPGDGVGTLVWALPDVVFVAAAAGLWAALRRDCSRLVRRAFGCMAGRSRVRLISRCRVLSVIHIRSE